MAEAGSKKGIGIELIEEAVVAANENAKRNHLENCTFLAGDVLKMVDELKERPDLIIVDPPRDGIHPKAIGKIIAFGAPEIVYVSCKPTSLARDLEIFQQEGYQVFFDYSSMRNGEFNRQIYDAIEEADDIVFIWSENALDNSSKNEDWVRIELLYAQKLNKHIIIL